MFCCLTSSSQWPSNYQLGGLEGGVGQNRKSSYQEEIIHNITNDNLKRRILEKWFYVLKPNWLSHKSNLKYYRKGNNILSCNISSQIMRKWVGVSDVAVWGLVRDKATAGKYHLATCLHICPLAVIWTAAEPHWHEVTEQKIAPSVLQPAGTQGRRIQPQFGT